MKKAICCVLLSIGMQAYACEYGTCGTLPPKCSGTPGSGVMQGATVASNCSSTSSGSCENYTIYNLTNGTQCSIP